MPRPVIGIQVDTAQPQLDIAVQRPTTLLVGAQLDRRLKQQRTKDYLEVMTRLDASAHIQDPQMLEHVVAAINNESHPPYELEKPRKDLSSNVQLPIPWNSGELGFIGVWDINDNGDVPPRGIIKGESTFLVHPAGVAINAKKGEVYATDSVRNGLFTFLAPYFFSKWPDTGAPNAEAGNGR